MTKTLILSVLLIAGCNSTTIIRSSDQEAEIYVNGEYLGKGRGVYMDQKVAFSRNEVEIRKEGCLPENHTFSRNEKADIGAIIAGLFVVIPYLWVTEYKPERSYTFECIPETASP